MKATLSRLSLVAAQNASRWIALLAAGPMVGSAAWLLFHPSEVASFVVSSTGRLPEGKALAQHLALRPWGQRGLYVSVALTAFFVVRAARGKPASLRWLLLVYGMLGLPLLMAPGFEFRHVFSVAAAIGLMSTCAAVYVHGRVDAERWKTWDLSPRAALRVVLGLALLFASWMGFMAVWRFMTFHAEPYDLSWETNAVHTILHTGIPRISVAAGAYYPGVLLPANYADAHTPWIYYLYVPFYAIWQDPRTLLVLQAVHMAAGALGIYWFSARWLRRRWLGVVMAFAYLAHPGIQSHCLHDLHANYLAIPTMFLALGLMETGRVRWAFFCLFVTAFTREETGVYALAVALFWIVTATSARRAVVGIGGAALSLGALMLITKVVMPAAGGRPRFEHFGLFFDDTPGMRSLLESYLYNPAGALDFVKDPYRSEYILLSSITTGALWLLGFRAAAFLLIPIGLLFPANSPSFFIPGMNYSAPILPPILVMGVLGLRRLIGFGKSLRGITRLRIAGAAYVVVASIAGSYVYGNVFSKTYKLEYGQVPFRRLHEWDYGGGMGAVARLPAWGPRERELWEVVKHVPNDGPISTSWYLNPALSNRMVSMIYPVVGEGRPKENLAKYIVLDRLYPTYETTEAHELTVRQSGKWEVIFENRMGVVFRRKASGGGP